MTKQRTYLVKKLLGRIPRRLVERTVRVGLGTLADSASPVEALRSLFRIENDLYGLEGKLARSYGNGEHTKHRHTNYHAFFVKHIEPGDRVIDIGCGDGTVTRHIGNITNVSVVGIDQNQDNINAAEQKHMNGNVSFFVGDALVDLPARHYDVVILSNVLEHIKQRVDFLRNICRLLTPRTILIRVPMFDRDWRVPLKKEIGVEWRLDSTHETEYTKESFLQELELAGFEIRHLEIRWGEIWAQAQSTHGPSPARTNI